MKKLMISLIRFYQKNLSPKKPPCCKYYPSCSSYAVEAIEKRGAFVGFFLAVYRILRCNPFSKGGYDPVPEKRQKPETADRSERLSDAPDAVSAYRSRHSVVKTSSAESLESTDLPESTPDTND